MANKQLIGAYSDYLDKLNIHTLRNLARRVGVYKPTEGKKQDLIERTIAVLLGDVAPVPPSKFGAPVKEDTLDEKYMRQLGEIKCNYTYGEVDNEPSLGVSTLKQVDDNALEMVHVGILELAENGSGWLRIKNSARTQEDIFISAKNVKAWNLREGDRVSGTVLQSAAIGAPELKEVRSINADVPNRVRADFDSFEARYPDEKIPLTLGKNCLSTRYLDLFVPIGKGQRAVVLSPSATDGNCIMRDIAYSVNRMEHNGENYHLVTLLLGESPETVTEFLELGAEDIFYTTFDKPAKEHLRIARLAIERVKRMAEQGFDVVFLVDSLTRLTLSYDDLCMDGKVLPCGLNVSAFSYTHEVLSLARKLQGGTSVTVIATLLDGELPVQQAVKEECLLYVNSQIHFSKELLRMGVTPAIDLIKSYTYRGETLLLDMEWRCNQLIRQNYLQDRGVALNDVMKKFERNADFVENVLKNNQ